MLNRLPWARCFGGVLVFVLLAVSAAAAQTKRAFLVGIDTYDELRPLQNAIGDGQALEAEFVRLGYQATFVPNPKRREFNEKWQEFLNSIRPGDSVIFTFSGHGIQIDRANYLLPRDVPKVQSGRAELLKSESLALNDILSALDSRKPGFILIILDACREDPFADGRSTARNGLAQVDAPERTFIMFSAGPNQLALDRLTRDDPLPFSVYTRVLVPLLRTPGLTIVDLADKVGVQVRKLAETVGHAQSPAFFPGLGGSSICLAGCTPGPAAGQSAPRPYAPPAEPPVRTQPSVSAAPASPPRTPRVAASQQPPPGACRLEAEQISIDRAGRAMFRLTSTCGSVTEIDVRYQGATFRRAVTNGQLLFDLYGGPGPIAFETRTGQSASVSAQMPGSEALIKVVLIWTGAVDLNLHILQDGWMNMKDAIWADNPRDYSEARAGQSGFLSSSDDGSREGDHFEAYTFFKVANFRRGGAHLRVENASRGDVATGEFCGTGGKARVGFKVLRYDNGRLQPHASGFIPDVPCGTRLDERARFRSVSPPIRIE